MGPQQLPPEPCPNCGETPSSFGRFCERCGNALPPTWDGIRLFSSDEGTTLGIGFELKDATSALQPRTGCARWFFGVMMVLAVLGVVWISFVVAWNPELIHELTPTFLVLCGFEILFWIALWLWSTTQPYAAAITALVTLAATGVLSLFAALPLLKGKLPFLFFMQLLGQAAFLYVVYRVARASRYPQGPTPLYLHPRDRLYETADRRPARPGPATPPPVPQSAVASSRSEAADEPPQPPPLPMT
jgi:hypothetical protein